MSASLLHRFPCRASSRVVVCLVAAAVAWTSGFARADESGVSLFNGTSLEGWEGKPEF